MLTLSIPEREDYNELTNEFLVTKGKTIQLEHSLVSLSKWESKWCKPYLTKEEKTEEEFLDYIRCMTITPNVEPDLYRTLRKPELMIINGYINSPMTATIIHNKQKTFSREIVTSELIYYWMISLEIPFECQKWHLNRLLTLIDVCNIKSQPSKKMPMSEAMSQQKALNAARRAKMHSKG